MNASAHSLLQPSSHKHSTGNTECVDGEVHLIAIPMQREIFFVPRAQANYILERKEVGSGENPKAMDYRDSFYTIKWKMQLFPKVDGMQMLLKILLPSTVHEYSTSFQANSAVL